MPIPAENPNATQPWILSTAGTHPPPEPAAAAISSFPAENPPSVTILPGYRADGRQHGFGFIQINTNGLRLADDPSYTKALKNAGLDSIFLQFDGATDDIYRQIRGRDLLDKKMAAIEICGQNDIGVVSGAHADPRYQHQQYRFHAEDGLETVPHGSGHTFPAH
jgi:hypothetical protein